MAAVDWPKQGRCGACGRPAEAFPSGRWRHLGVPCLARSQTLWRIGDVQVYALVQFVPEGEPLPTLPGPKWITAPLQALKAPAQFGWAGQQLADATAKVREWLASEARQREE